MPENISLKIYTPDRTAFDKKVYRVVLPYGKVNLTIIEGRAPTSMVFNAGVLKILDSDNKVSNYYFIDDGIADIANNECRISTTRFIEHSQIDINSALEWKEKEAHSADFYQMVIDYLNTQQ